MPDRRIALVHDSLTQYGGAERVLEILHKIFPHAPVFTLAYDKVQLPRFRGWDIRTSWLQTLYNLWPRLQWMFPLTPAAIKSLNLSGYDLIISSSSSFAKNVTVPKGSYHVCYCHTPTRFLWQEEAYIHQEVPRLLRPVARMVVKLMRRWDYRHALLIDRFIANSQEVKQRISRFYSRDSTVVYPPVNADFWRPTVSKGKHFLLAGRLQAHKNNELIIRIFNEIKLPLRVVGTGRQEKYLRSISGPNITFLGAVSDEQLRDEYSSALGYLYPQLEDFGLMPLEAAACGTATLAYGKGGSLETVIPGKTGLLFYDLKPELISEMIKNWRADDFDAGQLMNHAKKFSPQIFEERILQLTSL